MMIETIFEKVTDPSFIFGFVLGSLVIRWIRKKKTKVVEVEEKKMMLKSRDMGNGKFEVQGIVFYADNHNEALRKYRKGKKDGR